MPYTGTCFRFYTQMWVEKKTKHLHIEFIVTSHNSVVLYSREVDIQRNLINEHTTINVYAI